MSLTTRLYNAFTEEVPVVEVQVQISKMSPDHCLQLGIALGEHFDAKVRLLFNEGSTTLVLYRNEGLYPTEVQSALNDLVF